MKDEKIENMLESHCVKRCNFGLKFGPFHESMAGEKSKIPRQRSEILMKWDVIFPAVRLKNSSVHDSVNLKSGEIWGMLRQSRIVSILGILMPEWGIDLFVSINR
ncbi:hypothetical protein OCU04_008712 [Sclerotinia nivalis]|uniref:Uncharacterized protein n=1 Tax=Sclerotinia nivalis TaxID=352851 RepID=A0A9X0AG35_9HELO|nr:hypothetical protein OCU04_008712 [Sclerotinia nivalis]